MDLANALDFIRPLRHGVLVTQKRDGRPQLSNISYVLNGDDVIEVSVTDGRAKTNNIRGDARVSLHVTRDDFYAYAVIEGQATLTPATSTPDDATADSLVEYYRAVAGEHPNWDEYRAAMVTDKRCLLRITPTYAYGMLP
jgi:PPOX class probable F420-dependent enzyme